ncbi:MAG: hypothetical protein WCS03_06520 [Bacteroidota bacterium]
MTRPRAIIFLTLLLSSWNISGQVNENIIQPGDLSLRIKSINFVKNNEYYNPVIEGYTLLGFFFQPELVYSPSGKVTLRAGAHLLKYSGANKFTRVRPVFSTTMNLSDKTALTIGTLSGSDKHRLFDPHFNRERLYNAYVEDGFQLTTVTSHFFNDAWLSWENFISKGDSTREVFTFGESFRYKSSPIANFIQIEIPFQVQFKHFGGQISNYPEHVETFFNLAIGICINFKPAQERYGEAGIDYLQFINNEFNGESQSGISRGYASWMRFHYSYKALSIGAAYWKSHNFYAPNGNTIYSSVSDYQPNVVVQDRRIITNFLYLNLIPESYLELFFGLDTYYDVDLKRLDNAVTLHLNFDKLIRLAILKH